MINIDLSSRSVIAFSLHNNKKSFSSAMDQEFLFTFNGVLIVFERRKNKAEQARKRKQFFPASGLPVHRGASDNFPAKT